MRARACAAPQPLRLAPRIRTYRKIPGRPSRMVRLPEPQSRCSRHCWSARTEGMLPTVALLLLANAPPDQTTLPRHPDPDPVEHQAQRDGTPTDPLFDRGFVATDDPAFILSAVENVRQGTLDAESAAKSLDKPELVAAAQKIG